MPKGKMPQLCEKAFVLFSFWVTVTMNQARCHGNVNKTCPTAKVFKRIMSQYRVLPLRLGKRFSELKLRTVVILSWAYIGYDLKSKIMQRSCSYNCIFADLSFCCFFLSPPHYMRILYIEFIRIITYIFLFSQHNFSCHCSWKNGLWLQTISLWNFRRQRLVLVFNFHSFMLKWISYSLWLWCEKFFSITLRILRQHTEALTGNVIFQDSAKFVVSLNCFELVMRPCMRFFFKFTMVVFKNLAERSVITQIANFFFQKCKKKKFKNKLLSKIWCRSLYHEMVPALKVWCTAPPSAEKHVVSISGH